MGDRAGEENSPTRRGSQNHQKEQRKKRTKEKKAERQKEKKEHQQKVKAFIAAAKLRNWILEEEEQLDLKNFNIADQYTTRWETKIKKESNGPTTSYTPETL